MISVLGKIFKPRNRDDCVTIVSGLPRSGTSMMMRMLEAGGMRILTDDIRVADEDNPRGYYEYEPVKKIKEDASWLDLCKGRAVKMVSMLLFELPPDRSYRVIFLRRDMDEILASQRIMLERRGQTGADVGDEKMAVNFEKHLRKTEEWLARQGNIDVLFVNYNDVIEDAASHAKRVNEFLGGWLDEREMAAVIEPPLYRQRKGRASSSYDMGKGQEQGEKSLEGRAGSGHTDQEA